MSAGGEPPTTRAAPLGQRVVFLPGANNVPRDWRDHGRKLAEFGFHVPRRTGALADRHQR